MSLKEKLRTDMTAAMKSRDELRTATLRMVITAISNEEVSGKSARELSDDEVLKVIAREAKKRREAAEAFDGGGRPELAARERAEGQVLDEYLPDRRGTEIAGARARFGDLAIVHLIASGSLSALYAKALEAAGSGVHVIDAETAVRGGLFAAARRFWS